MSDSLSLSVVENDFEQAKWKMARRFTQEAERLYSENDHVGAYKLCEKVLDAAPQYFPAQKLLEKCIESAVSSSGADEPELQPGHDTSPNSPSQFDSDLDDTLNLEAQLNRQPKKSVQFVDEDDTFLLELTNDSPGPSEPQKGHSSAANANRLDRRGRREKYVRELLLEGHFYQKQPIEVFLGLKELLWSEDTSTYVCPVPNCSLQFKTRVLCVNHFLDSHLKTDSNGHQVRPFACKTCKELTRFRTLQDLIKHGRMYHPRCRWMDPLVTAMQKDS